MLNSFSVAQSGLKVAQTNVENVMNNISNENTEGYKKRVVDIFEATHVDARSTGRGATVGDVRRITNIYAYDNLMKQDSKKSEYDELSTMLEEIESSFYETEDSGFSNDLDKYFQSVENLRSNPTNAIYRNELSSQGEIIVNDLKTLYSSIEDREKVTQNFLKDDVSEVNGILNDIGTVNKHIEDSLTVANDLLDKRDNLEARLSKYTTVTMQRNDSYSLSIGNTTAVRYDTNVHKVDLTDNYIAQKDVYATDDNESTLVNKDTWDGSDTVTYYFNKDISVTVTNGEKIDLDGDGDDETIDKDNIVRALKYKINHDPTMSVYIQAFNGQYSINENGNKTDKNDQDYFLVVEAKEAGKDNKFEGKIIVNDDDTQDDDGNQVSNLVTKNDNKSKEAQNDIHLEIFSEKLNIQGGKFKSMLDNVDTTSSNNKFTKYKDMLDNFARKLADMSEAYILNDDGTYVSGGEATLLDKNKDQRVDLNLFSGASVKTLEFNKDKVSTLDQENLDYLATLQWNENIDIDGTGENNTSFSKYFQSLKVSIASDKENVDYAKETQKTVTESLRTSYEKFTKVDKDSEMINLMKFQSAYEANAKVITIVDRMLKTLLGMSQ